MKIIFTQDVKKQGKKGEIKEVKDGFANYLIQQKVAVVASDVNLGRLERANANKKAMDDMNRELAQKEKGKIEKITLSFPVKTGEQDRVFGSISVKQIISELKNKGFDIDKKSIKIISPINSLGFHNVEIELYKDVVATLKVELQKVK
ncbi:MAG: 50S ribosomal protein L9 [Bacillales bacterium]|nr:50S ribosomal protein L9 [Bacillales bacterium]